jgi:glycosyltransferase involved in cell wall biosynthesis
MGQRLHILVLSDRDWTHPQAGGTGTNLHRQVRRWTDWGHRVSVIACAYPGAASCERLGSVTLHRVGTRATVFPRAIWRQWRGLVPDADVVLEICNGVTFLTPLWCRTPRVTLIHHIHCDLYRTELPRTGRVAALALEALPLRLLYRRSRFVTASQAAARDIARYGVAPGRIAIVHHGVDSEFLTPEPAARAVRPTLLYLGRLKRYKRVELLLDLMADHPQAVLEVVGDGDHRGALQAEIRRRGLEDRVQLHGHVSESAKREFYRQAWINVTASSAEGWGLTVIEAAACGTPTVALRVGGLAEATRHGDTGLLAADAAELSSHVGSLLSNRELRERMGSRAREHALAFDWGETARGTLALLDFERRAACPRCLPAAGLARPEGSPEALRAALP